MVHFDYFFMTYFTFCFIVSLSFIPTVCFIIILTLIVGDRVETMFTNNSRSLRLVSPLNEEKIHTLFTGLGRSV